MKCCPRHERIETDFIVIGGGVAGLRAAVDLAKAGRVLLLTKIALTESNFQCAQGGIAAPSSFTNHFQRVFLVQLVGSSIAAPASVA